MGWFTGAKAAVGIGTEAAKIVDKFVTTKGERLEMDADTADKLRAMFDKRIHGTWFDAFVDGLARLIRPGVTLWLCLGMDGRLVHLPDTTTVDPFWQTCFWTVLTFWFGGRALLKDFPKALILLKKIRAN